MDMTTDQIASAAQSIAGLALTTPVLPLSHAGWGDLLPRGARVHLKLEMFQQAGSFKARGALLGLQALSPKQRAAGVVAASGGNHALAVAWSAGIVGARARITMPQTVDPERIAACRAAGAEVTLHPDMAAAFAEMERIARDDGASLIHPFEAPNMVMGAATCGAEYLAQVPDLDVLVVPVGGGGLISGMALAAKLINPAIEVIGVEPIGADSMSQSLRTGAPVVLDQVATIADSLGAPRAMPMTFGIAQTQVDRMVQLPDAALLDGMEHLRRVLRITAEPACAASLAALIGPLRDDMSGRRVGLIACGSNIGLPRFTELMNLR